MATDHELEFEWVHVAYREQSSFTETYGFTGSQGAVNLEGVRILPKGRPSSTLLVFMHPASTLQLLPVPRAFARLGAHVLCAGSRYARNDTAAVLEKVLLDLGAYIRHAREVWRYDKVVLVGWSGGGSLSMFYQAEAERPRITRTPAGDPLEIAAAGLISADAVVFQAAHLSRSKLLLDCIDPSVTDEGDPDNRDASLDIYDGTNPAQPPYSAAFVARYRAAQLERVRRITARVKQQLHDLRRGTSGELERGFVTHRTLADPRFLDPALDPNDRPIGVCYLGDPRVVNNGPVGLGRFSTLRSWLSQWSVDDHNAHADETATRISVPFLAIENSADDAVPQPHVKAAFDAAASPDKRFEVIRGANHYYAGQPELLAYTVELTCDWLRERSLLES